MEYDDDDELLEIGDIIVALLEAVDGEKRLGVRSRQSSDVLQTVRKSLIDDNLVASCVHGNCEGVIVAKLSFKKIEL